MQISNLLIPVLLGGLAGFAAWKAGALTGSGAAAAAIVGGAVLGFGGPMWAAALLAFFVSSSLLSRLFLKHASAAKSHFEKGAQRDWGQVAANGGLATLLAFIHFLLPAAGWPWAAFLGGLAAVTADTWGTELGVLNRRPPRLITTGRPVPAGTSGGVSGMGLLAGLAGAILIGVPGLFTGQTGGFRVLLAAAIAGLAGSLFDSWLGATQQAIYYCPQHEKETEQHPTHSCGTQTRLIRGRTWVNNDLVNFAASLAGAGVAVIVWSMIKSF